MQVQEYDREEFERQCIEASYNQKMAVEMAQRLSLRPTHEVIAWLNTHVVWCVERPVMEQMAFMMEMYRVCPNALEWGASQGGAAMMDSLYENGLHPGVW